MFDPALRRFFPMNRLSYAAIALAVVVIASGALVVSQFKPPVAGTPLPSPARPTPVATDGRSFKLDPSGAARMAVGRGSPITVRLADGRILIAGGPIIGNAGPDGAPSGPPEAVPAEIYDPANATLARVTGTTVGQSSTPNGTGAGALLKDKRAFVVAYDSNLTNSCAYLVDVGSLQARRLPSPDACFNAPIFGVLPTLVGLNDGRVLLSGGKVDVYRHDISARAVLFDPATEAFVETGSMGRARRFHSATRLLDGRVLVVGGKRSDGNIADDDLGDAELYDPRNGKFAPLDAPALVRGPNTGVLLPDGRVLLVATTDPEFVMDPNGAALDVGAASLFDPSTQTFERIPSAFGLPTRVVGLPDGTVILGGIVSNGQPAPWWARLDPLTGQVAELPAPDSLLANPVPLADGRIVFVGGFTLPVGSTWGETNPQMSAMIQVLVGR
jgi:hypothetical protein